MTFSYDLGRVAAVIREKGYKKVALELPEGLRDRAGEMVDEIGSETGCEVFVSCDPCYGACDLNDDALASIGCEAVFHFGHTRLVPRTRIPVHYVEVEVPCSVVELLKKGRHLLGERVGLAATAQYLHILGEAKGYLEGEGHRVYVGRARGVLKPGQVLGCSFATARAVMQKVDSYAYIGGGDFHPLGIALATGKKTVAFDPETMTVREMDEARDRVLRQRFARIARARDARRFGVIVGLKKGQMRVGLALRLKRELEGAGRKAYLLALREVTPENLYSFRKLDAFVCTACPRVAIDDAPRFPAPILTTEELRILLGKRSWEEYLFDEMPWSARHHEEEGG
jgi:2-(3-amino-3-carboxypropyl)histidine synthase